MELYELSAPMGRHNARRRRLRPGQGAADDRIVLIREIGELKEALEQLRTSVVRWRTLYDQYARRCVELEATVAKLTNPH
jgi:hypothetical protein